MLDDDRPDPPSDAAEARTTAPRWDDQVRLLLDLALADLRGPGEVLPTMTAFRGDDALVLATLRPFARGGHQDPIVEVGALALALGADRVALSLSGRAWSMQDPIPPVVPGGPDLRQHVIVIHRADGTAPDPLCLTTVVPVLDGPGGPSAGSALSDIAGEGWVPQVLLALASAPAELRGGGDDLASQVVRCEQLGHRLAWSPAGEQVVRRARLLQLGGSRRGAAGARRRRAA